MYYFVVEYRLVLQVKNFLVGIRLLNFASSLREKNVRE
jgi:hypothetical protein